jgi:DNA-binding transcriptional LysR family regulator
MNLELRLLRYFAVVAEELHFGRAAERLYISQPALSQQIRVLEDQVGMPLFVRGPRGVSLTDAGETLLAEARELLERSDRLGETVEQLRLGASGTLRIAVAPGVPADLLPAVLGPLKQREPTARVIVRELTTPVQVAELREGSLDLGLLREPVEDSQLSRRCLRIEHLGVSVPTGHPLAARDEVALKELEGEKFICFPRVWAPSLHDSLVQVLDEAQVKTEFEASEHVSTTQGMVAAGLALTFSAPPWLENAEGIEWRPLADARIEVRTSAAWRPRNASPLLRTLVELLPPAADTHDSDAAPEPTHEGRRAKPGAR